MEVYLSRSKREGKKWVMRFPTKSVHFGQEGARDRTIIKGKEERIKAYKAYQSRHRNDKINIKDTIKGQGSVNLGIALLQDFKLIIDPNSTNLIKELNNYAWKEDKEVPEDKFNHCIDGVRYIVSYFLSNPHAGKYFIG